MLASSGKQHIYPSICHCTQCCHLVYNNSNACVQICVKRNVLQLGVLGEESDLVVGYTRLTEPEVSANR